MKNKSKERLKLEQIAIEQLQKIDDLDFCLTIAHRLIRCWKCPLYRKCNKDYSCFQNLNKYMKGAK